MLVLLRPCWGRRVNNLFFLQKNCWNSEFRAGGGSCFEISRPRAENGVWKKYCAQVENPHAAQAFIILIRLSTNSTEVQHNVNNIATSRMLSLYRIATEIPAHPFGLENIKVRDRNHFLNKTVYTCTISGSSMMLGASGGHCEKWIIGTT